MNTSTATPFSIPQGTPAAGRAVLQLLQRLQHGSLTLQLPDGTMQRFGGDAAPHAALHLHNWQPFTAALKSGDIGFAETFIAGHWSTPNLTELLRLLVRNRAAVEQTIYGSWLGRLFYRVKHLLNRNTRANSQKNIHAHYDLGNAFYRLWLDRTMNYSSALFNGDLTQPLSEAQAAKVRRALTQCQVQPGDRVLEVGCGWGALAEMVTTEFSASVVGVTLSTEQLGFARERLQQLGMAQRAELRLQDYRDIDDAPYDAICSIEMIEAVGREYWPTYFAALGRLLKPGGRACVQSIVIDDALFERYIHSTDFIQQYIFPGGCLPCPKEFQAQAQRAGLRIVDNMSFGLDYAETLRRWRAKFLEEKSKVLQLGFDTRFMRIWEFYLSYCEAAFEERSIDVVQYTLEKI
jgi:cyclopropane-fatty-acyl-phospholipid synthase